MYLRLGKMREMKKARVDKLIINKDGGKVFINYKLNAYCSVCNMEFAKPKLFCPICNRELRQNSKYGLRE